MISSRLPTLSNTNNTIVNSMKKRKRNTTTNSYNDHDDNRPLSSSGRTRRLVQVPIFLYRNLSFRRKIIMKRQQNQHHDHHGNNKQCMIQNKEIPISTILQPQQLPIIQQPQRVTVVPSRQEQQGQQQHVQQQHLGIEIGKSVKKSSITGVVGRELFNKNTTSTSNRNDKISNNKDQNWNITLNIRDINKDGLQFVYSQAIECVKNNDSSKNDYMINCPLCQDNNLYGILRKDMNHHTINGLWLHLNTCHVEKYSFSCIPVNKKTLHICGVQQPLNAINNNLQAITYKSSVIVPTIMSNNNDTKKGTKNRHNSELIYIKQSKKFKLSHNGEGISSSLSLSSSSQKIPNLIQLFKSQNEYYQIQLHQKLLQSQKKTKKQKQAKETTTANNDETNSVGVSSPSASIQSPSASIQSPLPLLLSDYNTSLIQQSNEMLFHPIRQYYHMSTFEPIHNVEYILNIDCEEDIVSHDQYYRNTVIQTPLPTSDASTLLDYNNRATFQQKLNDFAINEFEDVIDLELNIECLWNCCIKENPIIRRCELPSRMIDFVTDYAVPFILNFQNVILNHNKHIPKSGDDSDDKQEDDHDNKKQLYIDEIVLFILSRWDENELSRLHIEYCIDLFYQLIEKKKQIVK